MAMVLHFRIGDQCFQNVALRIGEQFLRIAHLHDASAINHGHTVADVACHGQRMRDDDQRHVELAVDAAQQVKDLRSRGGVECAGGLVAQHDGRIVGQRACDGHALLLAAGQLARIAVGQIGQSNQVKQIAGTLLALVFRRMVELQWERDVAQHCALLEQAEILEANNVITLHDIMMHQAFKLSKIKGISDKSAQSIMECANKYVADNYRAEEREAA